MTIYIALLRGINVGGKNIIKMKDLKGLFEKFGFESVTTYIQSGNIVFQSDESTDVVQAKIEQGIEKVYRFSVPVVVRTGLEFSDMIRNCPYPTDSLPDGESVHLTLLQNEPSKESIEVLPKPANEECTIHGKDIYLYLQKSFKDSKLAVHLHKLGVPATTRNWKTIQKLESLVKEMGE